MIIPLISPIDDDLSIYGELVSVEAFNSITKNLNYLIDAMPVGTVVPILVGMTGVPDPDPRLWQLCDGSMITDQRSPLRDHLTPDHRDKFMKGADVPGIAGTTGGSNTKNLSHNHGGVTQLNSDQGDNSDTDDDYITVYTHTHPIATDMTTPVSVQPVHIRILHYIKIF